MNALTGQRMREVLLQVVDQYSRRGPGYFQLNAILQEAARQLGIQNNTEIEQALLTLCYDLFRNGQLAWGYNLANPEPPFCHITKVGRAALQNISRDPTNPDGYLAHLSAQATLNPVAQSYMDEALRTYNAACFKATAVMVGCAAESLTLELRDDLISRITSLGRTPLGDLSDWRIRAVLRALQRELDAQVRNMSQPLREKYESYWPAFTQQIRSVRNDAGHPTTVDPVTPQSVHAALLVFPELARLSADLRVWVSSGYT